MESKDLRQALTIPAAVLAVGLVAATFVGGSFLLKARSLGSVIEVTGSAEQIITSDTVKWSGRISRTTGLDGLASGNAAIKADIAKVREALLAAGVKETELTVRPASVYPSYTSDANGATRQTGYNFDQSFTVESSDVEGVTKLASEVADKMLSAGVLFNSDGLEYYYSKLADLKLEMISQATANAKERAERIAVSTGASLGPVRSAGLGVFQVTSVNSTEISDYGTYDTYAIEKKVTAVARASFQLK